MASGRYAETTSVPIERSRMEIEKILTQHGADAFASVTRADTSEILFEMAGLRIRFRISMPNYNADEFRYTPTRGTRRAPAEHRKVWEQACRQRWRALYLMIRAKLEAIESGLTSLEEEFMANIALPSGETVGDLVRPEVAKAYATGAMPQFAIGGRE